MSILDNTFDFTIPLGFNCNSANALKISGKRKFKLPFDWMQIHNSNIPETYIKMIDDAINNNLKLNIIECNTEEKSFMITNYNAWIPHEPIGHDINLISNNYKKYFDRLINILQKGTIENKSKILIIISNQYSERNKHNINVIEQYKNYFENKFPNNIYNFLTINLGNNITKTEKWENIIISEEPKWKIIDGINTWTDDYLKTFSDFCKENINVANVI